MSRLPNAAGVRVADAKTRDYLLNPANPQNRGKARQFGRYGFARERWAELSAALAAHPMTNDVVKVEPTGYGVKYVVRCHLTTPDGRNPCLQSVWLIEPGEASARLVSAY